MMFLDQKVHRPHVNFLVAKGEGPGPGPLSFVVGPGTRPKQEESANTRPWQGALLQNGAAHKGKIGPRIGPYIGP